MEVPGLTESTIRAGTSNGSYARGEHYFNTGAVLSVKQRGEQQIEALVKGGDLVPYAVRIRYEEACKIITDEKEDERADHGHQRE